jgi:hypothetical protein
VQGIHDVAKMEEAGGCRREPRHEGRDHRSLQGQSPDTTRRRGQSPDTTQCKGPGRAARPLAGAEPPLGRPPRPSKVSAPTGGSAGS